VAGNVAGDAPGIGVPVPIDSVRVPLIQASHSMILPLSKNGFAVT
jgi:hypothetical protein